MATTLCLSPYFHLPLLASRNHSDTWVRAIVRAFKHHIRNQYHDLEMSVFKQRIIIALSCFPFIRTDKFNNLILCCIIWTPVLNIRAPLLYHHHHHHHHHQQYILQLLRVDTNVYALKLIVFRISTQMNHFSLNQLYSGPTIKAINFTLCIMYALTIA